MKLGKSLIARIAAVSMGLALAQGASVALAQDDAPRFEPLPPAAAPAPVTDYSMGVSPRVPDSMPLPLAAGMGGAAALLCAYYMLRRRPGSMMLAMAGTAMAVTIVNPHVGRDQWQPFDTVVPVITDGSFSQQLDQRPAMTAAARQQAMAALNAIPGVRSLPVDASGASQEEGSNVFTALPEHIGDIPADRLGGVIVVTDGQVHDIAEKTRTVPKDVPVYVVVTGREGETDRRLVLEEAPAYGVVDQEQTLRFRVVDDGVAPQGQAVRVTVTADGQPVATPVVATGQLAEITIKIPHAGANVIALEADALDGELTAVNNRVVTSINGTQDRMRVLLVSGTPNNSVRSWRTLLKSDDNVDLVHFTLLSDPDRQALMPVYNLSLIPFPADELFVQKIESFDLVILEHFNNSALMQRRGGVLQFQHFASFAGYVENGGALLVVAGDEFARSSNLYDTPLRDVLPLRPLGDVTATPYTPVISAEGQRHPVTRGLGGGASWGPWQRIVETETTGDAHVVMTGPDGQPLAALDRVGEGRVGMIASDNAWLWARGIEGGGPYGEMMRRVSHWLLKEPALEEEALRMAWDAQKQSLRITRQTMAPATAAPVVTLQGPDGSTQQITLSAAGPGLWQADVDKPDYGVYRALQGDQTVMASVGHAYTRELAAMLSTTDILRPVAEESRGQVMRFAHENGATVLPRIVPVYNAAADAQLSDGQNWGIRMTSASELKSNDRYSIPAWLSLGMFALFLGLGLAREKYPNVNPFRTKPPGPSPR